MKGITVTLYDKTQAGTDEFRRPVFTETPVSVDNVLVYPASATEIINETNLSGKKLVYYLCLPRNDEHDWLDRKVEFFGEFWHVYAPPEQWIDALLPLSWNRRIKVERYE